MGFVGVEVPQRPVTAKFCRDKKVCKAEQRAHFRQDVEPLLAELVEVTRGAVVKGSSKSAGTHPVDAASCHPPVLLSPHQ